MSQAVSPTMPSPARAAVPSAAPDSGTEPTVPTLDHAGLMEDLTETPRYVMPEHEAAVPQMGKLSCSFCGVGCNLNVATKGREVLSIQAADCIGG